MWIARLALGRQYVFMVTAIIVAIMGGLSIVTTPTDIFTYINIPMDGVIRMTWQDASSSFRNAP